MFTAHHLCFKVIGQGHNSEKVAVHRYCSPRTQFYLFWYLVVVVSTNAVDCLDRLFSEMTCYVLRVCIFFSLVDTIWSVNCSRSCLCRTSHCHGYAPSSASAPLCMPARLHGTLYLRTYFLCFLENDSMCTFIIWILVFADHLEDSCNALML